MAQADSSYTYILKDPLPGNIVIEQVQRIDDAGGLLGFEAVYSNPNISRRFTHKSANVDNKNGYCGWLRVALRNNTAKPVFYMLRLPVNIDSIDLYEIQGEIVHQYRYGILRPSGSKIVGLRNDIFPLLLQPAETKLFYIRLKTDKFYSPARTEIGLQSDHSFRGYWYFYAFYLGILLLLIVICFILAAIFHDLNYTAFSLPLVGMILFFSEADTSLHYLLDLPVAWQKYFNPLFSFWLMQYTLYLFPAYHLGLRRLIPWAFYGIHAFVIIPIIVVTIECINNVYYEGVSALILFIMSLSVYTLLMVLAYKGNRRARMIIIFSLPFFIIGIHLILIGFKVFSPLFDLQVQFQAGSLLVSLLVAYELYYRVRSTVRERLNALLENNKLEKEKADMLLKEAEYKSRMNDITFTALRAQMNPHFIFNCLNSIKLYTEQNNTEAASDYLTKFSRLIRNTLDNSRAETIVLAKELESLQLYLEMEGMRFKQKLQYSIHVNNDVDEEFIEVPPLLIQPYVENAIWHGLMHKAEGGTIKINVSQSPDHTLLIISIEDNGIGRDKAAAIKSKSALQRKSLGTEVTAERIALINEKYKVNAEVIITDLFDAGLQPAGTLVTIKLPIK